MGKASTTKVDRSIHEMDASTHAMKRPDHEMGGPLATFQALIGR